MVMVLDKTMLRLCGFGCITLSWNQSRSEATLPWAPQVIPTDRN